MVDGGSKVYTPVCIPSASWMGGWVDQNSLIQAGRKGDDCSVPAGAASRQQLPYQPSYLDFPLTELFKWANIQTSPLTAAAAPQRDKIYDTHNT
jgi:hypothetical protein